MVLVSLKKCRNQSKEVLRNIKIPGYNNFDHINFLFSHTFDTNLLMISVITGSNRCLVAKTKMNFLPALVHASIPYLQMLQKCRLLCRASRHLARWTHRERANRQQSKYQTTLHRSDDSPIYYQLCQEIWRFVLSPQLFRDPQ